MKTSAISIEPRIMAIPPSNAFRNLTRLPDGTIRSYGYSYESGVTGGMVVRDGDAADMFQPVYIESRDGGRNWSDPREFAPELNAAFPVSPADVDTPFRDPASGDYFYLTMSAGGHPVAGRSANGIDGPYRLEKIDLPAFNMARLPLVLECRRRLLIATQVWQPHAAGRDRLHPAVLLSDDGGRSWRAVILDTIGPHPVEWPHRGMRWQNNACEPSVVELSDGRLWMLMRTSTDFMHASFSDDGGESWTPPRPSQFHGTLTMPTLHKMSDGRILLLWCNTTPLPERNHEDISADHPMNRLAWVKTAGIDFGAGVRAGFFEDVFTNRDVLHAAISGDDGMTWTGLRELYLNPWRNESDFAVNLGGTRYSLDKSCHQAQALELSPNTILVAAGQHIACRRLILLDTRWLYERGRRDDFSRGLNDWSCQQYIDGVRGHCAYNRKPGARLAVAPDHTGAVMHIARQRDPELVGGIQGATWNFPALRRGTFAVRIRLLNGCPGARIRLLDRWVNPTDRLAGHYAVFDLAAVPEDAAPDGGALGLAADRWHVLEFRWRDTLAGNCLVTTGGNRAIELYMRNAAPLGISYAHFQCFEDAGNGAGFLVARVEAAG